MTRFWMRSLAAQLAGLLLAGLVLAFFGGCYIHRITVALAAECTVRDEFLARGAAVARLVESTPPATHEEVLRAAGTSVDRYWIAADSPPDAVAWQDEARRHLLEPLPASGRSDAGGAGNPVLANVWLPSSSYVTWEEIAPAAWPLGRPARLAQLPYRWEGFGLAVRLDDGRWLYAVSTRARSPLSDYFGAGLTALIVLSIATVIAIRVARPLRNLARAAERLGRGEDVEPLPLEGPQDIRQTTETFNRMQERLRRFVEDRTRMLAAAGHDLRTPITSLRLQAEFVGDAAARERMLETLDEMETTTEAVLAFAREEAVTEPSRVVDLTALVESLCDDLSDIGCDVTFAGGERVLYRCRLSALRRGLRNLVENAVRYGSRARVALAVSGDSLEIVVDDDGPGIPEGEMERVFAPFVRLDTSRNRATGGVGLGLAIARSAVRGHGGEILLANRGAGSGLRATVRLPRDERDNAPALVRAPFAGRTRPTGGQASVARG